MDNNHSLYDSNGLAGKYSAKPRYSHPLTSLPYATWLAEIGDASGLTVLDLACGSGHSSRLLAGREGLVTGVDISADMLALAREEEKRQPLGIDYRLADCGEQLDLGGSQYDLVTAAFLFNYAEGPDRLVMMMRNVSRHLNTGGRMVALTTAADPTVPRLQNADHSTEWIDEPLADGSRLKIHSYDVEGRELCDFTCRYWSSATHEACLAAAGLTDARWRKIRITEALKPLYPNWQELERHRVGIVLSAHKV